MALQRTRTSKLALLDGEKILFTIDHHWLAGVTTLVIPVSILLIALGLLIYSAVGGGFAITFSGPRFALDLWGWLTVGLVAFIGALWVLMGVVDRDGYQVRRWGLVALGLVVVVVLAYRAAGGEIYSYDPGQAGRLVPVTLLLLLVVLVAAFVVFYLLIDLLADKLILTDQRVVYYNGAVLVPGLIERQIQQDIMLEDIQNALSRTETYLQHWLNYSNITVQAANAGPPISFRAANDAKEMQRRIFTARGDLVKRQTGRNFAQLVNTRVYDDKVEKRPYSYNYPVIKVPFFARWFLADNPLVDRAQGTIVWYPHWIFLIRALVWPLGVFVLIVVPLLLAGAANLLASGYLFLIGLFALLGCVLWGAYMVEDYRNDRYMLTGATIVDIDKAPFGPESRRSADLGNIQTVNYRTTFLSNILGYGDVIVQTAGKGGAFTFARVPRPRAVAATINQHISVARKAARDRSLEESLNLLRQFHTYQGELGELRRSPSEGPGD